MANNELAGAVTGLAEVLQLQCDRIDGATSHSSVYGRFAVIPSSITGTVELAKRVVCDTANKGIHVNLGIAAGRLESVRDLQASNLAGHPINKAARLAFLKESVGWIAADAVIAEDARDAVVELKHAFGDETDGKVKRTSLKYCRLVIEPPIIPPARPKGELPSELAHVVVYDIVHYSEHELHDQVSFAEGLRARVVRALNSSGGSQRSYSPGGDGGVLVFRSGDGGGAQAAWSFAKALRDHCRGEVPIRIGIATGQVILPPKSEPIGQGILRADRASTFPAEGAICCTKRFWLESIETPDRRGWLALPSKSDSDHLLVQPEQVPADGTGELEDAQSPRMIINLDFYLNQDHVTFDQDGFLRAIEEATGVSVQGLTISVRQGSTIVHVEGDPQTLWRIFDQLRSNGKLLTTLKQQLRLKRVTASANDGTTESIEPGPQPEPLPDVTKESAETNRPQNASSRSHHTNARRDSRFPAIAVLTIEGGGAYGFSLLGQLQAVVESEVEPIAFAGTSAGAVIATLHWAGYSPREIREKFCELSDRGELIQLLGPFERDFDFKAFQDTKERIESLLASAQSPLPKSGIRRLWSRFLKTFSTSRGVMEAIADLRPHWENRGIFGADSLVRTLDTWLRAAPILETVQATDKLNKRRPRPEFITFHDFAQVTASMPLCPLFLPVTNVTNRQLEIVCSIDPRYANWPIAGAVRASAGFPVFFRPVPFGHPPNESYYVDGGVIANYPAWVFGHQFREALYRIESGREIALTPWLHVGLCLGPPTHQEVGDDRGQSSASFFGDFARLLGGGARQELEKQLADLISRTIEIRQPEDETDAPTNLLDFADCDRTRIEKMFKRGAERAKAVLARYDFTLPPTDVISKMLERLVHESLLCLGQVAGDGKPDNSRLAVRANLFMPSEDGTENWQIRYSVNMEGDPDEHLCLPKFTGLTGMCLGMRRPLICNLTEVKEAAGRGVDTGKLFGMPTELRNRVRDDRSWLASVPVFDHFACYPTRIGDDVRRFDGRFQDISLREDGAVFAILNLDANIDYEELNLDKNPEKHWTNVRIRSIIDLMRAVAVDIGILLTAAYGAEKEYVDG